MFGVNANNMIKILIRYMMHIIHIFHKIPSRFLFVFLLSMLPVTCTSSGPNVTLRIPIGRSSCES